MAVNKKGWLYFSAKEAPDWAKADVWSRFIKVKDTDNNWILMYCETPRQDSKYKKWDSTGKRIFYSFMKEGTYEVRDHSPTSIYLEYVSESTAREKDRSEQQDSEPQEDFSNEPPLDPLNCTANDARQWLIWREHTLLRFGRVPQGWSSVAEAFLDKIKDRETEKQMKEKPAKIASGEISEPKLKTEEETLYEIINSEKASARDKMAAQTRLKELDVLSGKGEGMYNPEPVIKEID